MAVYGVHSSLSRIHLDREAASCDGPRSFNISCSRQVRHPAHPNALPLCVSPVHCSLPADSELDFPHGLELISISLLPATSLLGFHIQIPSRKLWSSYLHSHILLVQRSSPRALCHVFPCLPRNTSSVVMGCACHHEGLLSPCYTICCHGMVSLSSPFVLIFSKFGFVLNFVALNDMVFTYSLEWWSFELILLLSGVLPNPQLETSVLSIWYSLIE